MASLPMYSPATTLSPPTWKTASSAMSSEREITRGWPALRLGVGYTAEPGSPSHDALRLLASWAASEALEQRDPEAQRSE